MKKEDVKNIPDWETDASYYQAEDKKALKLEDFLTEEAGPETEQEHVPAASDAVFLQTVKEVRAVRELTQSGKDRTVIANELNLTEERVTLIQMCLYGMTEDSNDEAAAHLVMMEE